MWNMGSRAADTVESRARAESEDRKTLEYSCATERDAYHLPLRSHHHPATCLKYASRAKLVPWTPQQRE